MDQAVDHGGGHNGIAEDFSPATEGLVGGDDHRRPFVARRHQLEEQVGGLGLEGDVADLVDDQQRDATEAGELVVQAALGMGLTETADPLGRGGAGDAMAGLAGPDAEADGQVGLAGAGRDGDRLQQLRAVLPCEVRVTSVTHPLFGRLLRAGSFRRRGGVLLLVVTLPDGSPGTIPAEATNVLGDSVAEGGAMVVLSADGFRRLHELVVALRPGRRNRVRSQTRK
jgi:hypothetical protein